MLTCWKCYIKGIFFTVHTVCLTLLMMRNRHIIGKKKVNPAAQCPNVAQIQGRGPESQGSTSL